MAAIGGEAPAPGAPDDGPDIAVTIVHKVKSKLGYTEIHTVAPPMEDDGVRQNSENIANCDYTLHNIYI